MTISNGSESFIRTRISRSADQVSTQLQGETVILNVKNGKYYNLNAVGSRVWELIEQPASMVSIVDCILNEYSVERQQCEEDVSKILQAMHSAGLVSVDPEEPNLATGTL